MILPSLLSHIREQSDHMQIADRTVIETDMGNIVQYEIWFMNSEHILRAYVEIAEESDSQFRTEKSLPMQNLRDHLNEL